MRSDTNGPLTTFLLFVPLVAVPLLAVFGVPRFEPVVASPGADAVVERGAGAEVRDSTWSSPEDVFAPSPSDDGTTIAPPREGPFGEPGDAWDDPFHPPARPMRYESENSLAAVSDGSWVPPAGALDEWEPNVERTPSPFEGNPFAESGTPLDIDRPIDPFAERVPSELSGANEQPTRFVKDESVRNPQPALRDPRSPQLPPEEPLTWRLAVRRLNELGIRHFQLEPGAYDEFHFSCYFTPSDNPRITHRFEAEATEPLRAVEKVLAQVEQWLAKR